MMVSAIPCDPGVSILLQSVAAPECYRRRYAWVLHYMLAVLRIIGQPWGLVIPRVFVPISKLEKGRRARESTRPPARSASSEAVKRYVTHRIEVHLRFSS